MENTSINLANYGHGAGFGDDALSQAPQSVLVAPKSSSPES